MFPGGKSIRSSRSAVSRLLIAALCGLGAFGARGAKACGVCFTGDGTVLTGAVNGMIFVMLGALVAVLGAFLAFIIYLARRERQASVARDALGDAS